MRAFLLMTVATLLLNSICYGQGRQDPKSEKLRQAGRDLFGPDDKPNGGPLWNKPFTDFQIDDWGEITGTLKIVQKLSETEAIVAPADKPGEPMLLKGFDMARVTDGKEFILPKLVAIRRTFSYATVFGSKKTILVLERDDKFIAKMIAAIPDKATTIPGNDTTIPAKLTTEQKIQRQIDEAKKRLWGELPVDEVNVPEDYPKLVGKWSNGAKGDDRRTMTITQKGKDFTGICLYRHPVHKGIQWQLTGTVTKDGRISARLVHTKAPKSYQGQTFIGVISKEGDAITGFAVTDDAKANYDYVWQIDKKADDGK